MPFPYLSLWSWLIYPPLFPAPYQSQGSSIPSSFKNASNCSLIFPTCLENIFLWNIYFKRLSLISELYSLVQDCPIGENVSTSTLLCHLCDLIFLNKVIIHPSNFNIGPTCLVSLDRTIPSTQELVWVFICFSVLLRFEVRDIYKHWRHNGQMVCVMGLVMAIAKGKLQA